MPRTAALALAGVAGLASTANASPFDYSFKVTNTSGIVFNDFHATFAGTGGTIANTNMVIDTAGTGVATPNLNMIDIVWANPVNPGDMFQVDFQTDFMPIEFIGATLTWNGAVIATVDELGRVTDPTGQTGFLEVELRKVPAPASMALLGAAGLVGTRRRR